LLDGEQKIAEYYFKNEGDVANMTVLTDRRLVVIYGNAEESYPLSKITAVVVVFNRLWSRIILGLLLAFIGIYMLTQKNTIGLAVLAIGAILIYSGWKGKTRLVVRQMGGDKYYVVKGRDPKLMKFIDAINSRLA